MCSKLTGAAAAEFLSDSFNAWRITFQSDRQALTTLYVDFITAGNRIRSLNEQLAGARANNQKQHKTITALRAEINQLKGVGE